MNIAELLLLALILSVDSFAVAISNALTMGDLSRGQRLIMSLYLAGFQALMPVLGYFAGVGFRHEIKAIDHWVALVLLAALGIRMMWEAYHRHPDDATPHKFQHTRLLGQSLATSVDALVIGITLAIAEENIARSALLIGLVTLLVSLIGLRVGRLRWKLNTRLAGIVGGLLLLGLGIKIFLEHQMAG